jgi:hypothetical protein
MEERAKSKNIGSFKPSGGEQVSTQGKKGVIWPTSLAHFQNCLPHRKERCYLI